ncbi:MAG: NADAR family protein [Ferruginibacter sp.]
MKYSTGWIKQEIEKGSQPEYLFFWGHTQKQDTVVDKSCFSQWFPAPFKVEGIVYPTAEHWMMAKKAALFNDREIMEEIIAATKPAVAKELGRKVKNFDSEIWAAESYRIVTEGNRQKFSQHESLKKFLLGTGSKVIVEASPVDPVWGIGLSQDDPFANDPFKWKGTNLLGFTLMEVRDFLKEQNGKTS